MATSAPIDDVPAGGGIIRLGQFLQLAGLVDSGGEAKEAIRSGDVTVNGDVDLRRGRQLQVGDVVEFAGRRARVSH
ncbi:RNA-binding S4 domain-containing protein [Demequina sp. NBRC 110052]|uniref:RNA-binding S4 domain-containing protein n=1 Tax=Demequina sp. NBRC 110052 TaxID=1570341 RepID=UPI0009FBFF04|nr:RNA-binding S4 domain-containing protein [Demequina sp. NBRC 110052]